jgi:putative ubiquitin-RnfH superfamily antitoxin RatB of RatAB toxin-antitoxin module
LAVTLVFSPAPRETRSCSLTLPAGSTLGDALAASGWLEAYPELAQWPVGIWGKVQAPQTLLHAGDRIEFYRPLRCDPKVARRERYAQKKLKASASSSTAL